MNFLDKIFLTLLETTPSKEVFVNLHASSRNLSVVQNLINNGQKVLDVGCGLGLTGEYLTKKGFSVTGIELDTALAERVNNYISYEIQNKNAAHLEYEDNSFDSAIFMYVFHHIPIQKHSEVLKEIERVLKPGGKMIMIEPDPNSKFDLIWDKIFFADNFYHYFDVYGNFSLIRKGNMRIFEVKKEDISALEFSYVGEVK
ncbi:MAG: class I SAM-dependent methyltransferase [Candidatus Diapherotrites archaeon]